MKIDVLDHGYVRLIGNFGSDLEVVNSARVSYDKSVDFIDSKDERLLEFLIKNKHDSTLRHCTISFEIYAPLMIARQWYKHAVSSTHLDDQNGWNESSRRYVTEEPVFYEPRKWRTSPSNSKQGSGDPVHPDMSARISERLKYHIDESVNLYNSLLASGVATEQARLFLPAYAMYVRWRWTTSLNAVLHFCSLRQAEDAQLEIQEYGNAVLSIVKDLYPLSTRYWERHRIG
jgi:thymidylate synthase (FAD)